MVKKNKAGSSKPLIANSQVGALPVPVAPSNQSAPVGRSPGQSKLNWKEHPTYVLGGLVMATATVVGGTVTTVYEKVVQPAREVEVKSRLAKLEELHTQLQAKLAAKDAELGGVRNQLKESKRLADELHLELRASLTAQVFSPNDPYPNGLRAVRVGEAVTSISRAYPKATIDRSKDGVWTLRRYHPTFTDVHFFFDEDDQRKIITHIRFDVDEANPSEFLRRKLRDALGPPRVGAKPEHLAWLRAGMPGVFQAEPYSYFVMLEDNTPRWWKQKP